MNLQNRLSKIETSLDMEKGEEFCECFRNHFHNTIEEVYEGIPYEGKDSDLPQGNYCQKCDKRVNPLDQEVLKNIILIYGDTGNQLI